MSTLEIISLLISGLTILTMLYAFRDRIFNKGRSEKCTEDRVADLEKQDAEKDKKFYDIGEDIKTIKENHLVHIQNDMNEIKINMAEINTTLKFIIKDK